MPHCRPDPGTDCRAAVVAGCGSVVSGGVGCAPGRRERGGEVSGRSAAGGGPGRGQGGEVVTVGTGCLGVLEVAADWFSQAATTWVRCCTGPGRETGQLRQLLDGTTSGSGGNPAARRITGGGTIC